MWPLPLDRRQPSAQLDRAEESFPAFANRALHVNAASQVETRLQTLVRRSAVLSFILYPSLFSHSCIQLASSLRYMPQYMRVDGSVYQNMV